MSSILGCRGFPGTGPYRRYEVVLAHMKSRLVPQLVVSKSAINMFRYVLKLRIATRCLATVPVYICHIHADRLVCSSRENMSWLLIALERFAPRPRETYSQIAFS